MYALWVLKEAPERKDQAIQFVLAYLIGLVTASSFVVLFSPDRPTVGASGAIFGVLGVMFCSKAFFEYRVVLWNVLIVNGIITFTIPIISWQAHLGGFLGGYALGVFFNWRESRSMVAVARSMARVSGRPKSYYLLPLSLSVLGGHKVEKPFVSRMVDFIEEYPQVRVRNISSDLALLESQKEAGEAP